MARPELKFQRSLYEFINREVDCVLVDREPMFRDNGRCDLRIFLENFDVYFIEIKWVGFSAVRKRDAPIITGEEKREYGAERAIAGAYQTKFYIDNNNDEASD